MKFKFDSNLEYQKDAINSIIEIFNGQIEDKEFIFKDNIISNDLVLSEQQILENIKQIQKSNNIKITDKLEGNDFTVEMETGTGKTYVYLRTIMELNKRYGFKKFIIIVPSVAIREGVLKTLEITKNHFKQLYNDIRYTYYEYDSGKLSKIRQFANSSNVEIMVMTVASFNKDSNIMNKNHDKWFSGQKPIHLVRSTKPILILDEPQNMEQDATKKAIRKLNPLFKLRYSATHRKPYNLVYRLSPIDAYNMGLVKKIEVSSVVKDNDFNRLYLKCIDIISDSNEIKAKLEVNKKQKSGFKLGRITVKRKDNLFSKTKSHEYKDIRITEINKQYNFIKFSNGIKLEKGQGLGGDRKITMKIQIQETIEEHFRKALLLKQFGIKVLSLFFIDRVANYTDKDGFILKTFEKEFNRIKLDFEEFKELDVNTVHKGYFSNYKSEAGMEKDKKAFDLIMKRKERLLSFDEPTQFIFSHSALKEGWDNPNVFNICTLNETVSEMKKRQEIGRGVRLPVNQDGDRITDLDFNILTVVANESYRQFVETLQSEYTEEGIGLGNAPPLPANRKKRKIVKLNKGFILNPEFKSLWKKISKKTKYSIKINTKRLITRCIKDINDIEIDKIRIKIEKVQLSLDQDKGVVTEFVGDSIEDFNKDFQIPNVINFISEETKLTKNTIFEIISGITNLDLIFNNPQDFISSIILIIKENLNNCLVNGIEYIELDEYWLMKKFTDIETYEDKVIPVNKSIYEEVIYDSKGERSFAEELDNDPRVKIFIKLPRWFMVNTPVGDYNPDWALVLEKKDQFGNFKDKLYLVRETKFVKDINNIRDSEKRKIVCANEHFKTIKINFETIIKYEDLIT